MTKPNGQLIRERRRRKALTVTQLARRAGVAEKTLRQLERDETETPHPETVAAVAGALGMAPEELFPEAPSAAPPARSRFMGWQLAFSAGAITALVAGGWWLARPDGAPGLPRPSRSIAVLPFENLSGDPEQEYVADGMTEELISELARLGDLNVISRTSVMRYKGKRPSLPAIAAELGVEWILEGSVAREARQIRVTAQLIDARTDTHVWSDRFDRELSSVLALRGGCTLL